MTSTTPDLRHQVHLITGATSGIDMNHGLLKILTPLMSLFAVSPEEGAETTVYLASSPDAAGVTGEYFQDQALARSGAASYDLETARRLWDISARMAGLDQEEPT
ncbi:MAG: hypothetical protein JXA93_21580 [Anaerolineae bacterium]|nr:hypothetical protein [Anaerolineae bacterium]